MTNKFPNLQPQVGLTHSMQLEIADATGTELGRQTHGIVTDNFSELAGQLGLTHTENLTDIVLRVSPHDFVYPSKAAAEGFLWVNLKEKNKRKHTVDDPSFVTSAIALAMLGDARFNPRVARDRKFDPALNLSSAAMMVGGFAAAVFNQHGNVMVDNVAMATACGGFLLAIGQTIHNQPRITPFYTYPLVSRVTRAHRPPKGMSLDAAPPIVKLINKEK